MFLRQLLPLVALTILPGNLLPGQAAAVRHATVGLLVVAHGADSLWNARVEEVVEQVEWSGPVELVYLMGSAVGDHGWDAAVGRLIARGATSAVAVPLMVSTHGAHVRQVEFYAGARATLPAALHGMAHAHATTGTPPIPVRVTPALDGAPELGEVLLDRWMALDSLRREAPLVLIAHGPSEEVDVPAWREGLSAAIAPLRAGDRRQQVRIGLLRDDAPAAVREAAVAGIRDTIRALASAAGDSVTVMTVLVSSGSIDRVKIPRDLDGMPMRLVGSVLAPHPALARWIERMAAGHAPGGR